MAINLDQMTTETRNQKTMALDTMTVHDFATVMNAEDQTVAQSVQQALPAIETAIQTISHSLKKDGRLFYIGAGTSGRLGVLDATECVPTFGTDPEMVQGLIAGGMKAMTVAVEGERILKSSGKRICCNGTYPQTIPLSGLLPAAVHLMSSAVLIMRKLSVLQPSASLATPTPKSASTPRSPLKYLLDQKF